MTAQVFDFAKALRTRNTDQPRLAVNQYTAACDDIESKMASGHTMPPEMLAKLEASVPASMIAAGARFMLHAAGERRLAEAEVIARVVAALLRVLDLVGRLKAMPRTPL